MRARKSFFFLNSKIVQIFNLRTKLKLFSHSNPHFASIAKRKAGIPSSRLERKQTIFSWTNEVKLTSTSSWLAFFTLRLFRAASAPIIVCTIIINSSFLYILGWKIKLLLKNKVVVVAGIIVGKASLKRQRTPETTTDTQDLSKFYWFYA